MNDVNNQVVSQWQAWDSLCSHYVRSFFAELGFTELLLPPSPPLAASPFVNSPTPLATAIILYALLVGYSVLFQRQSQPSEKSDGRLLRAYVQLHNLFLIVLSMYMFSTVVYEAVRNGYTLWGNEYDDSQRGLANVTYVFYLSKIYEFFDTVIMVVKGNRQQVSFLHVYHHVSISIIWWAICYVAPGGDSYYSAALNSLVHVFMYTYYFLASTVGKDDGVRRKWLWWGRYLTMFQITQFVTMLIQALYCIATDSYNRFLCRMLVWYMFTLLTLFGHFFVQKYVRKPGAETSRKAKAL